MSDKITDSIKLADPVDVIKEVFAMGWQTHNGDLVLHCLGRIETKLTHYESVVEAAKELETEMGDYLQISDDDNNPLFHVWDAHGKLKEALAALEAQDGMD